MINVGPQCTGEMLYKIKIKVIAGVRQGDAVSPILYSIYTNVLIKHLESIKLGCVINEVYFECIFYADDIVLLFTSLSTLQSMQNI